MTVILTGTEAPYTITYLEMTHRPGLRAPPLPGGVRLERAIDPPVWYFLALYGAVGRAYEWRDRFAQAEHDPEALQAFVRAPDVALWTAMKDGWPRGFFVLDWRAAGAAWRSWAGTRRRSSCPTGAKPVVR